MSGPFKSIIEILTGKPVYRSENIDAEGRHKHPACYGRKDIDSCVACGTFTEIWYWYGGYSVNKQGKVVPNEQVPLCKQCAREELR